MWVGVLLDVWCLCRQFEYLDVLSHCAVGVSLATTNRIPDGIRRRGSDEPFESIAL